MESSVVAFRDEYGNCMKSVCIKGIHCLQFSASDTNNDDTHFLVTPKLDPSNPLMNYRIGSKQKIWNVDGNLLYPTLVRVEGDSSANAPEVQFSIEWAEDPMIAIKSVATKQYCQAKRLHEDCADCLFADGGTNKEKRQLFKIETISP